MVSLDFRIGQLFISGSIWIGTPDTAHRLVRRDAGKSECSCGQDYVDQIIGGIIGISIGLVCVAIILFCTWWIRERRAKRASLTTRMSTLAPTTA